MNTIVALTQLGTRPYKVVSAHEMDAIYHMSLRDPMVLACVNLFTQAIMTHEMEIKVDKAPHAHQTCVEKYWRAFALEAMIMYLRYKFCPYVVAEVMIDASGDEDWMKLYSKDRDAEVQAKTLSVDVRYHTLVRVPKIPAYGTYMCVSVTDDTYQTRVLTLPNESMQTPENMPNLKPIQTLMFGAGPRADTGEIQSIMAALLKSCFSLGQMNAFAVRAGYSRAHPPVVLQHVKTDDKLDDMMAAVQYGDGSIFPNGETLQEGTERHKEKFRADLLKKQQETLTKTVNASLSAASDFSSDPSNLRERAGPLRHTVEDAMMPLAYGLAVGPQPTLAEAPADLAWRSQHHAQMVCSCFGIPYSMLSSMTSSDVKNAVPSADDNSRFMRAVNALHLIVEQNIDQVFAIVHGAAATARITVNALCDPNLIMTLYEIGTIDAEEMHVEMRRAAGFGQTRKRSKTPGVPRPRDVVKRSAYGHDLDGEEANPRVATKR